MEIQYVGLCPDEYPGDPSEDESGSIESCILTLVPYLC